MRLHTRLTFSEVHDALLRAQNAGKITPDVFFVKSTESGSRTHPRAFEIQLGTRQKYSLPPGTTDQYGRKMRVRRYKDGGNSDEWAATWHEWGWFIAEVFTADPTSRWAYYASREDFDTKTGGQFS